MDDITIPPEALEAAIKAFDESEEDAYVSHADDIRAACIAMLRNWPDSILMPAELILPLPKENTNAEA